MKEERKPEYPEPGRRMSEQYRLLMTYQRLCTSGR